MGDKQSGSQAATASNDGRRAQHNQGPRQLIAALFLTTEVVVAEKPEKEKAPAGMPDGWDMDF